MNVRIGTSGWVYAHWRGIFYPNGLRQSDWFAHYARRFDTVEINNSFYRLPSIAAFDNWQKQAPLGFRYAVKASRFLTHMKKLKDPEEPLRVFFERAAHLGRSLGPVLYQLPPHWGVNLPRFEHFLCTLPSQQLHAVEFRDPSWLVEDTFQLMERFKVGHCIHDMVPLEIPLRITASFAYVRLHGDVRHGGDYPQELLRGWANRIEGWLDSGLDVYVFFNNDFGGYAIKNALTLRELLPASVDQVRL